MDNLSLKGTCGLDVGDKESLSFSTMNLFSSERWPAIARAAKTVGASEAQVRKWRVRKSVPGAWHLKLLSACVSRGISLSSDELLATQNQKATAA